MSEMDTQAPPNADAAAPAQPSADTAQPVVSTEQPPVSAVPATASGTMNIQQIMAILPHRYPFLLIDRVSHIERKKRITAWKNVSVNEPQFQGHFPDYPILPGVLMIEAIAQAGGALLLTEIPDRESKLMVFTGIERAKFRRPVVPGDALRIEVEVLQWKSRAVRMEGKAYVGEKLACEAVVTCQLVPRPRAGSSGTESAAESAAESA